MVRKSLLREVWTTSSSLSHSPHALSIWGKSSRGPYLCSVVHCYYPSSLFWIVTTRMYCPNCSEHVLEQNGYKYLQNASDQSQSVFFKKFLPPLPPLASTWKFPPSPNSKSCMNPWIWGNDFFKFDMEIFQDRHVSFYPPTPNKKSCMKSCQIASLWLAATLHLTN